MQKFTTLDSLTADALNWAESLNMLEGSTPIDQFGILAAYIGCLEIALRTNMPRDIIAGDIGDCVITLAVIAKQNGLNLSNCLAAAFNELKDIKGVMIGGEFIPEADARYNGAVAKLKGEQNNGK